MFERNFKNAESQTTITYVVAKYSTSKKCWFNQYEYSEFEDAKTKLEELRNGYHKNVEYGLFEKIHKNGMNVQIPILSKDNTYVVEVADGIYATMLQWIPGHIIDKNKLTKELYFEIGQLVARLN